MSAIAAAFERCREQGRAAFVPYLTAGDPDLESTGRLVAALARAGADVVELGVPFSDPIADGPVNQRAASRALAAGTTLAGILELVAAVREQAGVPIVLFTYYNPVHRRGVRAFCEQAADSGVDGVLCVDLPPEEAAVEVVPELAREGLDRIFLLAPTSGRERLRRAAELGSGFLYYVSRTGVTGEREALPPELAEEVRRVRKGARLPVAVGFGISTAEQVAQVAGLADGVVVGSALVRVVEEHGRGPGLVDAVEERARTLAAALARPRRRWFG
jgi:tryptophan synthase alpha chain